MATIIPALPYTLTNGTVADANQVMGDLNAIVTAVNGAGAHNGPNADITSLSGLTTPLSVAQGGTSANTPTGALTSLGAAASGPNSDITSLSGLTSPLPIIGVTDGSNAAAGRVGEYVTQSFGATGAIAAATVWNVGSMVLTAGDWDVWGSVQFTIGGGATPNNIQGIISTGPSTAGSGSGLMSYVGPSNWSSPNMLIGVVRFNSAASQTAYLNIFANPIAVGSVTATGVLYARRRR